MKKLWAGITAAVIALAAFAVIHQRTPRPAEVQAPLPLAYVAGEGKLEAMPGYDVDLGTGELNGKIARIFVREGDQVHKGQIVASLTNEDLRAQVIQSEQQLVVAQARLTELQSGAREEEIREARARLQGAMARMQEAHNQLQRDRDLHRQKMISQATLEATDTAWKAARASVDEAAQRKKLLEAGPKPETVQLYRDQVQLAEASLDHVRKRLDKTLVRSPIDGTVIERYLDEGEGVTPEIPILAIADLSETWINAEIDETDIGRVQVGDAARVTSDAYPGQTFHGAIREIASYAGVRKVRPRNPAANLGLKVIQVKIQLANQTPLRLGMTVDVRIIPSRESRKEQQKGVGES